MVVAPRTSLAQEEVSINHFAIRRLKEKRARLLKCFKIACYYYYYKLFFMEPRNLTNPKAS